MRGFTYLEDQSWIDREMTRGSDLPISLAQAARVTKWLKHNYGPKIEAVTKGSPFPPHIICAIACQETAYFWLKMSEKLTADEVLARCVLDASGELPSDPRSAFPRNTHAFRSKYGDDFTEMLISEANTTRVIRGLSPREWVYKGYGIFQYDLQAVVDDEPFFHAKQWYSMDFCLARVMQELRQKWARTHDLWLSVKAYNGSGSRADQYMRNVQKFADVTEEVWLTAPGPDPVPVAPPAAPPVVVATAPVEPAVAPAAAPMGPAPSAPVAPAAPASAPATAPLPMPTAAQTAAQTAAPPSAPSTLPPTPATVQVSEPKPAPVAPLPGGSPGGSPNTPTPAAFPAATPAPAAPAPGAPAPAAPAPGAPAPVETPVPVVAPAGSTRSNCAAGPGNRKPARRVGAEFGLAGEFRHYGLDS